ncbi:ArnT family glycosyltransferase [Sphingomonas sp. NCPPB 2930]|uniref:ArnT family glycosyltransferase n=1 Tax=Sphingomonas sp. NCPPB 2930 TaxID=3162788 RepID=UPI0036D90A53
MNALGKRHGWYLPAILMAALMMRLATIRFGLPGLNDPDELMFEMGAIRMLTGPTLNPGWFGHPATTTIYLLAVINIMVFGGGWLSGLFASPDAFTKAVYTDPSWIILPGRIAMMFFGIATIWLTARLAARLFGNRTGVIAALLLAFNPVHMAWSQIIRSDMMACLFMLMCLGAAIDIAEQGRWRDYVRAALWLGLAIATKWPFALSAIGIVSGTWLAIRSGVLSRRQGMIRLAAAGLMAIGFLFVISPYLLLAYPTVIANLQGEGQAHHLGATGGGFLANLWWYIRVPLLSGFGMVGLGLFLLGWLRLPRQRQAFVMLAPMAAGFLIVLCSQRLIWERWALPLMMIGAMVAAHGLTILTAWLRQHIGTDRARHASVGLLGLTLAISGQRAWADGKARTHDTRQIAAAWSRSHIPPGSIVLVEHFAFDLLNQPWHFLFPMGNAGCVDAGAMLHGRIRYATIERARRGRSNVDYGTVSSHMRTTCTADFAILTQAERYHAERNLFSREDEAYQRLEQHGRVVATFRPLSGKIGGPTVTIIDFRQRR